MLSFKRQEAGPGMENALFYTFSTIAQALAAAMALLSAFALYRLQSIDSECQGLALTLEAETSGGATIQALAYRSDWAGVLGDYRQRVTTRIPNPAPHVVDLAARIERRIPAIRRIKIALWISLAVTAVVIAGSVIVLALVPVICAARAVLCAGIVATLVCLSTYLWLVFECFREP
jgi:hypothetical protein